MRDNRGEQLDRHPPRYKNSAQTASRSGTVFNFPFFMWVASGNDFAEQLNGSTKTDDERIPPYSDPNSEPPDPMDRAREERKNVDEIHRLIQNTVLYNPLRVPRYPIVLCHGAPLADYDLRINANLILS